MHIKEAYQRRIKQQTSPRHKNQQIDHSTVIGSVHTGQLNYHKNQPFFIDFKVKDQVRQARNFITTFKDADILELKPQRQWNSSVIAPRKFSGFQQQQSHKTKLLKIKLGFSDFSPIKQKPNKIYQGTQTRNNYAGWNVSTFFDKKQKNAGVQLTNLSALDNTIAYNKQKLSNYKTLSQRYKQTRNEQKSQLLNSSDIIQELKQSYRFTNPNSSPEKTSASVHKMFKQMKLSKIKASIMEQFDTQDSFTSSRFRAKLSPTQKQKIKFTYFHTGCWQKCAEAGMNNDSDEDKQHVPQGQQGQGEKGYAWTCCQSGSKDGRGCSFKVIDGNRMNLSSFSHA